MEHERRMIGERIRHARKSAGMTLGELSEALAVVGETITRAGISKYELGKSVPKAKFLKALGRALDLPSQYFLQAQSETINWRLFRKKARLSLSRQDSIKAKAADLISSQLWLEITLNDKVRVHFPEPRIAKSLEDAENIAELAREYWGLGRLPVESVTSLLESHGFVVVEINDPKVVFDGLSGWIDATHSCDRIPLIVVNTCVSTDRFRYNLAHELGHLLLGDESIEEKEEEKFAHRFAASFLAPRESVYRELGDKRRNLLVDELGMLKQKYGLSMQGWIKRAFDLGIIEKSRYQSLFRQFSSRGWRKKEPYTYRGYETPSRYRQLLLRAQAENIVSEGRTHLVIPEDFWKSNKVSKARTFIEMRPEKRNSLLKELVEQAVDVYDVNYLSEFDDLGVDDFYDYTEQG